MKHFKLKILKPEYLFLLLLVLVGVLYNYLEILTLKPCGIHQWRSAVSAAFPVNYYYGGNFFTPQTNALLADNYTSDITVVEFPLLYFIISIFYRIFGINEMWFRLIQVSLGFLGLIWLFKASYHFTRDWFYAGVIPMLIFTSPIYVFYLNGFIPDAVALSLSFGGFYYFLKYSKSRRFRSWMVSMLLFLLAGLTKTSSLLPFFGLGGVAVLDFMERWKRPEFKSMFDFQFKHLLSYGAVIFLIVLWYIYAKVYSEAHSGSVSAVEVRPIWILNQESIREVLDTMARRGREGVYHLWIFLGLSLVLFLGMLPFYKKGDRFLYRFTILLFIGALAFTLLFFRSMRDHDYYQINNLFLLAVLYLSVFVLISKLWSRIYTSVWTKIIVTAGLVLLVLNCDKVMKYRYSNEDWHYYSSLKYIDYFDIEAYLEELGIDRSARVHCTPDPSINISLYMCNRKGLTDFSKVDDLNFEQRIEKMRRLGIEYVILGDRENFKDVENLDQLLGEKVGQTGLTEIFKLSPHE